MIMMKVLWITNILFPEVKNKLVGNSGLNSSGGWMLGAAENLVGNKDINLYIATVSPLVKDLQCVKGESIVYYIIPYGNGNLRSNSEYQYYWKIVNAEVCPDVVHIHGTEYSHGYEYIRACGSDNVVISIQGLKSAIAPYYHSGMSKWDIYSNITIRDILRGSILREQRSFTSASRYEVNMLKMTKHIIGRTSWDRARTRAINPDVEYHFCNEILRTEFYDGSMWDYQKCRKHTIFLSQAGYPIKGLHQVLKAMPLILRDYPDTSIRIAGTDITKCNTFRDLIHFTGYGRYIKRLIRSLKLEDKVIFVGNLNAEGMKQEYLHCNVFVCPSSIENSPNSLGEAQILGVPCVASYVGGVPDMMCGNEENLYRFEEIEMLAETVCNVFKRQEDQTIMIDIGLNRHSPKQNVERLYDIYISVIGNNLF